MYSWTRISILGRADIRVLVHDLPVKSELNIRLIMQNSIICATYSEKI